MYFSDEHLTIINEDVLMSRAIEKEYNDLIVTSPPNKVDIEYSSFTLPEAFNCRQIGCTQKCFFCRSDLRIATKRFDSRESEFPPTEEELLC